MCFSMILRAMLPGALYSFRVTHGKLVFGEGTNLGWFIIFRAKGICVPWPLNMHNTSSNAWGWARGLNKDGDLLRSDQM